MKNKFSLMLVAIVVLCSCGNPSQMFSSEKMLDSGYDAYQTYAFLPTTDTMYAKMVDRKALVPILSEEAVKQLEKKGMRLDNTNPDCLFTYRLVVSRQYEAGRQEHVAYNPQVYNAASTPIIYSDAAGASYVRSGSGFGHNQDVYYFSSNNRPYTYSGDLMIDTLREGSMVIDMIDAKTNKVIWRSVAESKRKESEKRTIEEAVSETLPKMFRNLPRK